MVTVINIDDANTFTLCNSLLISKFISRNSTCKALTRCETVSYSIFMVFNLSNCACCVSSIPSSTLICCTACSQLLRIASHFSCLTVYIQNNIYISTHLLLYGTALYHHTSSAEYDLALSNTASIIASIASFRMEIVNQK